MDPEMVLEMSLVARFVRTISAVVELLTSMLVSVTKALSSGQSHKPIANLDSRVDMDFVHVTIL